MKELLILTGLLIAVSFAGFFCAYEKEPEPEILTIPEYADPERECCLKIEDLELIKQDIDFIIIVDSILIQSPHPACTCRWFIQIRYYSNEYQEPDYIDFFTDVKPDSIIKYLKR